MKKNEDTVAERMAEYNLPYKRVSTGLPKLDKLIVGGFPHNSVVLLSGPAGCGKTLLGLNFLLDGARKGEKCCYLSLGEPREELIRACWGIKTFGGFEKYLNKNFFIMSTRMGSKMDMEYFISLFREYQRVDRIVVDNTNRLFLFSKSDREYRLKLYELVSFLKGVSKCAVLLAETKGEDPETGTSDEFECDGAVHIAYTLFEEKPKRTLVVQKMRYTDFEPRVPYELHISSKEIALTDKKII
jgi:circadian clock protein KaiC